MVRSSILGGGALSFCFLQLIAESRILEQLAGDRSPNRSPAWSPRKVDACPHPVAADLHGAFDDFIPVCGDSSPSNSPRQPSMVAWPLGNELELGLGFSSGAGKSPGTAKHGRVSAQAGRFFAQV